MLSWLRWSSLVWGAPPRSCPGQYEINNICISRPMFFAPKNTKVKYVGIFVGNDVKHGLTWFYITFHSYYMYRFYIPEGKGTIDDNEHLTGTKFGSKFMNIFHIELFINLIFIITTKILRSLFKIDSRSR